MTDTPTDAEAQALSRPGVALVCERPGCDYVVFTAQDGQDHSAEATTLMEGHLRQHDDPEVWKAEQEVEG